MRTSGSRRAIGFEGAQALLDDAVVCVRAGGETSFVGGQAEEEQAAEAEGGAGFGFFYGLIYG